MPPWSGCTGRSGERFTELNAEIGNLYRGIVRLEDVELTALEVLHRRERSAVRDRIAATASSPSGSGS